MNAEGEECRRRCDVLRKTVPDASGGDRESSVAVGWQSGMGDWQSWRWSWPKKHTSVRNFTRMWSSMCVRRPNRIIDYGVETIKRKAGTVRVVV